MNLQQLLQPHIGDKQICFGEVEGFPAVYSYGPHYPIAIAEDDMFWLNEDQYILPSGKKSPTTTGHRNLVQRVLAAAGYRPSAETTTYPATGYTYRRWRKEIHSLSDLDIERQNAEVAS